MNFFSAWETQYRVVGTTGATSYITWHDTEEMAVECAKTYHTAAVYRPDGSLLGRFLAGDEQGTREIEKAMKLLNVYKVYRGKFAQACDLEAELDEAINGPIGMDSSF